MIGRRTAFAGNGSLSVRWRSDTRGILNGSLERRPWWVPAEVDVQRPSAARVYDFFLGGYHNFPADRDLARKLVAAQPDTPLYARMNRRFLNRAVRYLAAQGVRQFLDLGSGIPTFGNVHQLAGWIMPDPRVVYVDVDPVAVRHSRLLLSGDDEVGVIEADLRDPRRILDHPEVNRLIDFNQPVAVLMVAVLHFVPDADDPAGIIADFHDRMSPGSYLAISHATWPLQATDDVESVRAAYEQTGTPLALRSRAEIQHLLDGFGLVDPPGLCRLSHWLPDGDSIEDFTETAGEVPGYAAVCRRL
jgi:hypothetical protein